MTFYIYALFMAALAIITIKKPSTGIVAVLIFFALEQWAQASSYYFMQHNWLTNYLIVGVVLIGLISTTLKTGIPSLTPTPVVFLTVLLFLYSFSSAFWSSAYDTAMDRWELNAPFLALVILVTPLLLRKTSDLVDFFSSYILFAVPLAILLLFTVEWWGRYLVVEGTSSSFDTNPNAIGNVGVMLFMIALIIEVDKSKRLLSTVNLSKIWPVMKWIVVILGIALALKSQSRGHLAAAAIATPFALWTRKDNKDFLNFFGWIFFIALLSIIAYIVFGYVITDQTLVSDEGRWTAEKIISDMDLRFEASLLMLEIWSSDIFSIIFGLGNSAAYSHVGIYIHVVPLEILTEEGLIGFSIFLAIILITIRNASYLLRAVDLKQKSYIACLVAFFAIELILYCKQGSLVVSPTIFLIIALIDKLKHCEAKGQ